MVKISAMIEEDIISRKKNGESDRCVAKTLKISTASVSRTVHKHNIKPPTSRIGRPPKVQQHVKNLIVQKIRNKETRNAATASKLILLEEGLKVTPRHI